MFKANEKISSYCLTPPCPAFSQIRPVPNPHSPPHLSGNGKQSGTKVGRSHQTAAQKYPYP